MSCKNILKEKINIINKFIKKYIFKLNNLETILYNKTYINYNNINAFNLSTRCNNDHNNKVRENIICAIINNKISNNYYKYSPRWNRLKEQLNIYIKNICLNFDNNITINNIKCLHKAGRNNNYDFNIIINDTIEFNIEFKFNVECVSKTPQFVSPMKPSQYINNNCSYEEYYYDNYLNIIEDYGFKLPLKTEYLKNIHSPKPKCIIELQKKYYNGCKQSSKFTGIDNDIEFYNKMIENSNKSIKNYIINSDLNIDKLNKYLLESQKNKYYMLFKNNYIYFETVDLDNYIIKNYKKEKNRYVAVTKSGVEMKILLRWKNGNGIAFPAFQIS